MTGPLRAVIGCTRAHGLKREHRCSAVGPKILRALASIRTGVTHGPLIAESCTTALPVIFQANHGTRKDAKFGGVMHNRSGLATMFLTLKSIQSRPITWELLS